MALPKRLRYLRRVVASYVLPGQSQLTFWHETPEVNEAALTDRVGQYYMTFTSKADYPGHLDDNGIPMLDYHGDIGLQYNPIAVAQYGLGNYNLYERTGEERRLERVGTVADWLVANLEPNRAGIPVWHHHFDWEYRDTLRAPWYSGLAQGQGISLLLRANSATGNDDYLKAAADAFRSLTLGVEEGGVIYVDPEARSWVEEYIVSPPTHILNGFMWALWGVHDYRVATGDEVAGDLFDRCVETLRANLPRYDAGFWSLYEQSGTRLRMMASPFYHSLHIVQLEVMYRLTGDVTFADWASRWRGYERSRVRRLRALGHKAAFKLFYY